MRKWNKIINFKSAIACSIDQFNDILEYLYKNNYIVREIERENKKEFFENPTRKLGFNLAYIYDLKDNYLIYVRFNLGKSEKLFYSNKTNTIEENVDFKLWSIATCIRTFQRFYNNKNNPLCNFINEENLIKLGLSYINKISNKVVTIVNNAGILINKQGNYKNVVEYDLKSAWLTFLAQDKLPYIPVDKNNNLDLSKCYYEKGKIVAKDEIGFALVENYIQGTSQYYIKKEGEKANYIFKLEENKHKMKLLNLKKKINDCEDKIMKKNWKNAVNFWIGNLTHHNPFLRSYIIQSCNDYLLNLINKYEDNYIYSVTDSLAFNKEIEELNNNNLFSIKFNSSSLNLKIIDNNRFYYDNEGIIKKVVIRGLSSAKFINKNIENLEKILKEPDSKYKLQCINIKNYRYKLIKEN